MAWYDPGDWGIPIVSDLANAGENLVGNVAGGLGLTDAPGANLGADAAAAVAQSNANAQAVYQQALDAAAASGAYAGPAPITAQSVSGLNINAPTVQAATPVIAPSTSANLAQAYRADVAGYDPTTYNAIGSMQMLDKAGYKATMAGDITPATVADVGTAMAAGQIGPAAQAANVRVGGTTVGGTTLSPLATDTRGEQLAAARGISSGPLSSDAQFRAAAGQVLADQIALANQARGADRAGARREAMLQAGQREMGAGLSAAALAAQEEQARRTGYASALAGVRGQDVTTAQTQAQLDQSRNELQANLDQQRRNLQANLDAAIATGNVAQANELRKQQAILDTSAQQTTIQAGLAQQATKAKLAEVNLNEQTLIDLQNADAATKMTQSWQAAWASSVQRYTESVNEASRYSSDVKNRAEEIKAGALNTASNAYAAAQTATSATNAAAANQIGENNAARTMAAQTTNTANQLDVAKTNAAATQAAQTQNAANYQSQTGANAANNLTAQVQTGAQNIEAQGVRQSGTTSALGVANTAAGIQGSNAATVTGGQRAGATAQQQQQQAVTGLVSTAGMGLLTGGGGSSSSGGGGTSAGSAAASNYGSNPSGPGQGVFGDTTIKPNAITSDIRAKTDVRDVRPEEIYELAMRADPIKFRYRPGIEDSGQRERAGVPAQEIEQAALGRDFVRSGPDGYKQVDYGPMAALMAAEALREIRRLEGQR